jgi:hypothetical protein
VGCGARTTWENTLAARRQCCAINVQLLRHAKLSMRCSAIATRSLRLKEPVHVNFRVVTGRVPTTE